MPDKTLKSLGQIAYEAGNRGVWPDGIPSITLRWELIATAVKAAIATWAVCKRCNGQPMDMVRAKCPACEGLGRVEPNGG